MAGGIVDFGADHVWTGRNWFRGVTTVPMPQGATEAAPKGYVDDTLANSLKNVPTPTQNAQAAPKSYVDSAISQQISSAIDAALEAEY